MHLLPIVVCKDQSQRMSEASFQTEDEKDDYYFVEELVHKKGKTLHIDFLLFGKSSI